MNNKAISLIEFSVENYKIFKDKVTFSMETQKGPNSFQVGNIGLLRTSVIYGPNASGKTTLLEAFNVLQLVIVKSADVFQNDELPYHPFSLSDDEEKPTSFEVILSIDKKTYKYNLSYLKTRVVSENLTRILVGGQERKTWNNDVELMRKALINVNVVDADDEKGLRQHTVKLLSNNFEVHKKIVSYLQRADFNVSGIKEGYSTIFFLRTKYNKENEAIGVEEINIEDESSGMRKFFNVLGPIVWALETGGILFVDNLDAGLHPTLVKFILNLFDEENPRNAQLIITSHNTSLMSYKNDFIKYQFWFTERDKYGAATLFSLSEYNALRNDTEYEKKYLNGLFGALPYIIGTK